MESIKDRVAIVGMGCTTFGELWDKGPEQLMAEAAYEAFTDAGIGPKDLQAAWLSTVWSGEVGTFLSQALKLPYMPVTRVENRCASGTDALRNAAYAVAAGIYDIVLVLGIEKCKDSGWSGLSMGLLAPHPVLGWHRSTPPSEFALRATRYFERYGLDPEVGRKTIGKIAVKNHYNGSLNPKAHFQREVTLEQVINAPMVAWPLGLFDCCGVSDGAAAAILVRADMARDFRDDPLFIKGLGMCCGAGVDQTLQDYDLTHFEETVRAGRTAYDEAGITDPFKEIGVAVVHDCFTITELIIYEDLGCCPRGQAKDYIDSNAFALDGELPVNSDGGLKCFGHPVGASGLRMLYENYKQIQGKAGAHQIKKRPTIGLTHNLGGAYGGWAIAVSIIGL